MFRLSRTPGFTDNLDIRRSTPGTAAFVGDCDIPMLSMSRIERQNSASNKIHVFSMSYFKKKKKKR